MHLFTDIIFSLLLAVGTGYATYRFSYAIGCALQNNEEGSWCPGFYAVGFAVGLSFFLARVMDMFLT